MKEDISNPVSISLDQVDPALGDGIRALGERLDVFLQEGERSAEEIDTLKLWLEEKEEKTRQRENSEQNPLYMDLADFLRSQFFEMVHSTKECLKKELENIPPEGLTKALRQRIIENCTQIELLDSHLYELLMLEAGQVPLAAVEAWVDSFVHAGKDILPPLESQNLFIEQDLVSLEILTQSFIDHTRKFVLPSARLAQPDVEKTIQGDTLLLGLTFHTHTLGGNPTEKFIGTSANVWTNYLSHSLAVAALIGVGLQYDFPEGNLRMTLAIPLHHM